MNNQQKLTKLDLATWAGFIIMAISGIIVAISLPEISATFSTNLSEGGGMETARTILMFCVLLLAGMLAQRWGKKRFIAGGQFFLAAGFFLSSLAPNYLVLVLTLLPLGIGAGFTEGLVNPLIVDIHKKEAGRYLNFAHAFFPLGVMGAAVLFGELLTLGYSWRLLFQIGGVAALGVALMFTLLPFPPAPRDNTPYNRLFASVFSSRGFWLFALVIIFAGAIEGAITFWSRTYVGIYFSAVPRAGALAVVLFAAAMFVGRLLTAYLANKSSLNGIMIASAVLGLAVTIFIPQATTISAFYALLALAGLAVACFWPTILAEADAVLRLNTIILFVLLSSMGVIGHGASPLILGLIGDNAGLKAGFALIPFLFIALIALLLVERWQTRKSIALTKLKDEAAQRIV